MKQVKKLRRIIMTQEISRVFRIVVAGIIVKNQSVLLLQRREDETVLPGMWEFPSGKRQFGETSENALIREVKEELGVLIEIECPISVFEYMVETPTEIRDTTQINFLVHLVDPRQRIKINKKEHQAARCFRKNELLALDNISAETRKCALSALKRKLRADYSKV